MQPVYRVDAYGEAPVRFPTLRAAVADSPSHPESYVATSAKGVHLADAFPVRTGELRWFITRAGQDVIDRAGWVVGPPVLSQEDYDVLLGHQDFEVAS